MNGLAPDFPRLVRNAALLIGAPVCGYHFKKVQEQVRAGGRTPVMVFPTMAPRRLSDILTCVAVAGIRLV